MAIAAVPAVVFAADGPELQIDGLPDTVKAGQAYTFTVGAVNCGDKAGTQVKGVFSYDSTLVEKVEYYETDPAYEGWHEFTGNEFGPVDTGFPLMDALKSQFRVTFKGDGEFNMNIKIVEFANPENVLITADKTITVEPIVNPTVTVNLANEIKAGQPTEFTVSTTGGDATDTMVKGVFTYDTSMVEKVEYYETDPRYEGWHEFTGNEFGPVDTGFPLKDLTSRFRVTFKEDAEGEFSMTVNIVEFANPENVLATTSKTITVEPIVDPSIEVNMPSEIKTGEEVYFDVTTHAGDFANTTVKALLNYDKSVIEKLEYQESKNGEWYNLMPYDSFGPEGGYPLTEGATSHFRVTFKEAVENYSFNIQIVAVNGGAVLAESTTTIQVREPVAPTVTVKLPATEVKTGEPMEFTVSTTQGDTPNMTMVKGVFTYDETKVEKLEYYETAGDAGWMELKGNEFGPVGTGFPLMDLTSRFRVTFKEAADDYSFSVQIVAIDGGAVLAQTTASIDVVPSHVHTLTHVEAKDPTCTEPGNKEYWECTGCGKYFSDADATVEITDKDSVVIDALNHNAVKVEAKDPTCTEDGNIAYWYCDRCEKYFSDEALTEEITLDATMIDALNHDAVKVEAKEPTATEDGNIEYWYCDQCDKYFKDAALTEEITLKETVLPATGETETTTEPETSTDEDGTQAPAEEQPETGDSALPMFAALAAVSGLAVLALRRRRK